MPGNQQSTKERLSGGARLGETRAGTRVELSPGHPAPVPAAAPGRGSSRKPHGSGPGAGISIWLLAKPRPAGRSAMSSVPPITGPFALHSQPVPMVCHQFLAKVGTARERRQTTPRIRSPSKDQRCFPVSWPAQAVRGERGRLVLPMGRGRPSLVCQRDLPERIGGCKLVWKDGAERHVSVPVGPAATARGQAQAPVEPLRNSPGGPDHQHGGSAGGVWARDPVPQAAAPEGPGAAGQETQALPAWLATVAPVGGRSAQGERPQAAPDPRPAPPRHPAGERFLKAARRGERVHRPPGWGAPAEQRTPPPPADGWLGRRPGQRRSDGQSQSRQQRALHGC